MTDDEKIDRTMALAIDLADYFERHNVPMHEAHMAMCLLIGTTTANNAMPLNIVQMLAKMSIAAGYALSEEVKKP